MPVKVGLIGCGGIAQTHCREYYGTLPAEAQLVACADPDPGMRQRVSELLGVQAYADTAELLARPDIDVVDICTPPSSHPALIRQAAAAGKHVLCEKPLALDFTQAAAAIQFAEEVGVQVGSMQNYRWRPEYAEARNAVAGGRIGRPFMASIQALLHWHGGANYRRTADKMLMLEVTYHYVDLLRFLLGSDVERVYAVAGRPETTPIAGDTYAAMILHFTNGAVGNIVNSGECQGVESSWGGEAVVQGEQGTIYINRGKRNTFALYSSGAGGLIGRTYPDEMYGLSTNVGFDKPLRAYYQAFERNGVFPVTSADNLNTLGAVLGAYESAQTRQPAAVATRTAASLASPVGAR